MPDFIPYFVQNCFHVIYYSHCDNQQKIEEAFHNEIYPYLYKDFFYQFDEKLQIFSTEQMLAVEAILDLIAKEERASIATLRSECREYYSHQILHQLINHEFLTLSGQDQYSFPLRSLRVWWMRKRNL